MAEKRTIAQKFADDQTKAAAQALLEDWFENYHRRRYQIYWMNFVRGIFLGFGSVIGGTAVVALLLWLLSSMQYVPFLDSMIQAVSHSLQKSH